MLNSEQQTTNKSPEINIFQRGLSVFLDPFPTTLETSTTAAKSDVSTTTNLDLNNSEKTYDLADYLYNQTTTTNKPSVTTLTQLEPVRPATPPTIQHQPEMVVHQNIIALNECSMDSSSSNSSKELVRSTATKRGRKPASANNVQTKKFAKFELVDDNKTKTLVYFGNKKVEVGTEEYEKRRRNNNDAVKKCRQKMEQEQKERESKMQTLVDENRRLNEKVNTMSKEMEVLKGIIISMKPDNALPEFIQKPLNDL